MRLLYEEKSGLLCFSYTSSADSLLVMITHRVSSGFAWSRLTHHMYVIPFHLTRHCSGIWKSSQRCLRMEWPTLRCFGEMPWRSSRPYSLGLTAPPRLSTPRSKTSACHRRPSRKSMPPLNMHANKHTLFHLHNKRAHAHTHACIHTHIHACLYTYCLYLH